jgi:hypothetical protein
VRLGEEMWGEAPVAVTTRRNHCGSKVLENSGCVKIRDGEWG